MLSLFQPVAVLTGHHYIGFNHSFTLYSEVAGSLLFENDLISMLYCFWSVSLCANVFVQDLLGRSFMGVTVFVM